MTLLEYYELKRPRSYETSWHHRWTCDVLERAYRNRQNAIFEFGPRHSKSEIINAYAPAWWINDQGHYDAMFGLVANSDSLAKKFSSACRNLCTLPLEIDRDADWKVKGQESLNSTYRGVGVRGQLSGHGFDTVMFDDLLKSGAEAKSEVVREGVWDGVVSAAINRLTPDGIIIALQARLHQQDTIGKLLELEHLNFLHLHLPAVNDSGTEAFFRDGYSGEEIIFPAYEALWPTRYNRAKLDDIKATVSSYYWNAQYQAAPTLGDEIYFEVDKMPTYQNTRVERCWMAVDAAQTATVKGSYTAFVGLGYCTSGGLTQIKVLSVARGKWRQDEMAQRLYEFYTGLSRLTGIMPEKVIIERAAAGFGLLDHFAGKLPVEPVYPRGSKEERAGSVCYVVNRGVVSLPASASWLKAFKDELGSFPLCAAKDQTDAFVHALSYALRPSEFKPTTQVFTSDVDEINETLDDLPSICSELDDADAGCFGVSSNYMGEATMNALMRLRGNLKGE